MISRKKRKRAYQGAVFNVAFFKVYEEKFIIVYTNSLDL